MATVFVEDALGTIIFMYTDSDTVTSTMLIEIRHTYAAEATYFKIGVSLGQDSKNTSIFLLKV